MKKNHALREIIEENINKIKELEEQLPHKRIQKAISKFIYFTPQTILSLNSLFMLVQSLLGEFKHEAENTRKLLNAIPDTALSFKPSEKNWTTGQLASHIAEIYNWYPGTLEQNEFDMAGYKYDKGDISKAGNIVTKFEENVKVAQVSLEKTPDASMMQMWSLKMGDTNIIPPMMRIQAVRGFLMNHLYHHRGELIVYLRSTGNTVPGLYGPTADSPNF